MAGCGEVADDESVDAFVDFEFVFAFPVSALLEEAVALVDLFLDLVGLVEGQVDGDQFEGDVHLLADLDGLLQGQVVGVDGRGVLLVVVEQFCLGQQCVSYFCFSEVVLCVFDFAVFVCEKFFEGFLDVHIQIFFKLILRSGGELSA